MSYRRDEDLFRHFISGMDQKMQAELNWMFAHTILGEAAQALQCPICFDVLYYAKETNNQAILEEIGQKEGELIRQYRPLLNTQIPKAENWHKWDVDKRSTEEIMRLLLEE